MTTTPECETFRKLSQHPFEEVRMTVRMWKSSGLSDRGARAILAKMGWTADEYRMALLDDNSNRIRLLEAGSV
jgi:hypothetical protein